MPYVVITSAKRIANSTNGNPRLELVLATESGPLKLKTPSDTAWAYALPRASDLTEVEAFAEWHRTPSGRYVLDWLWLWPESLQLRGLVDTLGRLRP